MFRILLLLLLVGCVGDNIKSEKSKIDTGNNKFAGKLESKELKTSPILIQVSGNGSVTMGDKAIESKNSKEIKKSIVSNTVWDMKLSEAYSKYSTYGFIFIGLGLLLIIFAIKTSGKTSVGRAFCGVVDILSTKLKHASPKSDESALLNRLLDEIQSKQSSFFRKG